LNGPFFAVLEGLPKDVGTPREAGVLGGILTTCFSPDGDAMFLLNAAQLRPGQSVRLPLIFYTQTLNTALTSSVRVLRGQPSR
jgi:hypothetical protein